MSLERIVQRTKVLGEKAIGGFARRLCILSYGRKGHEGKHHEESCENNGHERKSHEEMRSSKFMAHLGMVQLDLPICRLLCESYPFSSETTCWLTGFLVSDVFWSQCDVSAKKPPSVACLMFCGLDLVLAQPNHIPPEANFVTS